MEEKNYALTLAFMKRRDFENGGYVIQGAISIDDLKKLKVRSGKVYVKLQELKKETQYGAKYTLVEDDYMATYGDDPVQSLESLLHTEYQRGEVEVEKPYEAKSESKPSEEEDLFE